MTNFNKMFFGMMALIAIFLTAAAVVFLTNYGNSTNCKITANSVNQNGGLCDKKPEE